MKSLIPIVLLAVSLTSARAADAPDARVMPDQIVAAVKDVQGQQAAIADNQAKIEAKLATLAEAIRLARIYSSRGGK